jgi:hypothetical protein
MMKMIDTESINLSNLNEILAYLKYQGPLYLRRIEECPPIPPKISSSPLSNFV